MGSDGHINYEFVKGANLFWILGMLNYIEDCIKEEIYDEEDDYD